MTKDKFQPSEGYVIPENGIEIINEGKTVAVRFDIAKCEVEKTEEGEVLPQQYEANFIRVSRSEFNYADVVSAIIRSNYTQSDVEAIILNGSDTEEHAQKLTELQQWRTHAKEVAKQVLGITD